MIAREMLCRPFSCLKTVGSDGFFLTESRKEGRGVSMILKHLNVCVCVCTSRKEQQ